MAVERGQATVETAALWGLLALLLLILAALLGPGLASTIVRALSGELPHARSASRSTPDERALRNPRLRALIDRALPRLVLERDDTGDDDEVPVWTSCRHALCARAGRAAPVLHVHVVHTASGPVVELWTFYPDSQTSHLPIAALRGQHRDDWEGLLVAFAPRRLAARRPRLGAQRLQRLGALVGPGRRRLGALCRSGLPRERIPRARLPARRSRPRRRRLERRPRDRRAGRLPPRGGRSRRAARPQPSTPRSAPPWDKAAWRNPGTRHTGTAGAGSSRIAAAARVWAEAYALGAW